MMNTVSILPTDHYLMIIEFTILLQVIVLMDLMSQGLQPVTMEHSIVRMLDILQRLFRPVG